MGQLDALGISPKGEVFWDSGPEELYEHALQQGVATLGSDRQLVVDTTPYSGRSPQDKFIIREPETEDQVDWGGFNQPMEPDVFDKLYDRVTDYLSGRQLLYVQDNCA